MAKTILYRLTNCSYGNLLIAASKDGLCAIKLGNDTAQLLNELHTEFSQFDVLPTQTELTEYLDPLINYLTKNQTLPKLKCDFIGTEFQKQVWQYLQTIPKGVTYTYSELAKAMNKPKSVRAIANACASNKIAIVVPCHRIIPKSGGVGKYRWGIERKAKLLEMEHQAA